MNNLNFDIVIVGLGPTGGTLANLLAMNNVSVLILEKEAKYTIFLVQCILMMR